MSTPLVRLPSLDLVRGFVAVGRRMSITLAAQDLCVTQSAVSRQYMHSKRTSASHCCSAATGRSRSRRKASGCSRRRCGTARAAGHRRLARGHARAPARHDHRQHRRHRAVAAAAARAAAGAPAGDRPARRRERQGTRFARRRHRPRHPLLSARPRAGRRAAPVRRDRRAGRASGARRAAVTNAAAIADHVLLEFDGPPQPLQWRAHLHAAGDARPKGVLRFNQYDQVIQAAIAVGRRARPARARRADARGRAARGARAAHAGADGCVRLLAVPARSGPRREVADVRDWMLAEAAECDTAMRAHGTASV